MAPNSNWREMICNYFYSPIAFNEDSEDEESAMGVDDSSSLLCHLRPVQVRKTLSLV